jgi:hypothetical protein
MKHPVICILVVLGFVLSLGGCASYNTDRVPGRSFAGVQRFFVVSNQNDNHALDHQIADILKARGREAEVGPLTMRPDNSQVIITYRDHWTWDFGDHMVFLQLAARDTRTDQIFATVTFSAKIPLREEIAVTVGRLVDRLLDNK